MPDRCHFAAEVAFVERTCLHIRLVQQCAVALAKSGQCDRGAILALLARVVVHDASKFLPPEASGYRRYWHELTDDERDDPEERARFDPAWIHHARTNRHHAQYFNLHPRDEVAPEDVLEMICDWAAMAAEQGTSLEDFVGKSTIVSDARLAKFRDLIDKATAILGPVARGLHYRLF